jgi:predicted DNA binding CopG/RHH family protein
MIEMTGRPKTCSVRMTIEEFNIIKKQANAAGVSVSKFIRAVLVRQGAIPDRLEDILSNDKSARKRDK